MVIKILSWPFYSEYSSIVSGIGFYVSAIGFIATFVGLAISYKQIIKTRGAATAAKDEVDRVLKSLNRYKLGSEAMRAEDSLRTAKNHLRERSWLQLSDSYEDAIDCLHAIVSSDVDLPEDLKFEIDKTIAYIKKLQIRIERQEAGKGQAPDEAKTMALLSDHRRLASKLSRVLEQGFS